MGDVGDADVQGVHSFADTPEGNKRAEKLFLRCIKQNYPLFDKLMTKVDKTDLLDEGYFVYGNYRILLTHSI
jgi:hypothetical protein